MTKIYGRQLGKYIFVVHETPPPKHVSRHGSEYPMGEHSYRSSVYKDGVAEIVLNFDLRESFDKLKTEDEAKSYLRGLMLTSKAGS